MAEKWIIDESESDKYNLVLKEPCGWFKARLKYHGCVELYRYYNEPEPENEDDYGWIHICSLIRLISFSVAQPINGPPGYRAAIPDFK